MLVLSRFVGESIIIAVPGHPPIRVVLLEIRGGGQTRIGVEAPDEVIVDREEVAAARARDEAAGLPARPKDRCCACRRVVWRCQCPRYGEARS